MKILLELQVSQALLLNKLGTHLTVPIYNLALRKQM